jgi:biofilm PGA synthesis lipoprotein PgaB
MKNIALKALSLLALLLCAAGPSAAQDGDGKPLKISWSSPSYLVLCYHDVPLRPTEDNYAVDVFSFIAQLEFLRDEGCHFISLDDLEKASSGQAPLPEKAVLLTFDDAYQSFYKNVFPLLKLYKCPAVLAVVSRWIDETPSDVEYRKGIMTREQLKELSDSGLVEIASHSFDSHKAVQINPQGNSGPALSNKAYDPKSASYETEAAYVRRIGEDLRKSRASLAAITGKEPRALMWPYGRYSGLSLEEAKNAGFPFVFTLDDGLATAAESFRIPRHMLDENPNIVQFAEGFQRVFANPPHERLVQVSLDRLYDADPALQARKLDRFLDGIVALSPTGVYLQAFASPETPSAPVRELYFPNSVMKTRADLLSRVSRTLMTRGIQSYVCLPLLKLEAKDGAPIDPLSSEGAGKLQLLFRELAGASMLDGVSFQDDGFLAQVPEGSEDALVALTEKLKKSIFAYRPIATISRTLYAPSSDDPAVQARFRRSYAKYLAAYDFTVLLCCPEEERLWFPERWLGALVAEAKAQPGGIAKTIFNVQAYDWRRGSWVAPGDVRSQLRATMAAGAFSIGCFPYDYQASPEALKIFRDVLSSETFAFNK